MIKNNKLKTWIWKWHFIAGLISLPFILILSITGIIYLFKANYETPVYHSIKTVEMTSNKTSFQKQWDVANIYAVKKPNSMIIPNNDKLATEFVSGKFAGKSSIYINPYSGKVSGEIVTKDTFMFKVRKLHGELLMGKVGTKIVELIASWMVVLIITGLYIWWPSRNWSLKEFFVPRIKKGKRIFFRDIHAISGFWISILLLLILAGGFPWTDVVGNNFKTLQNITNTGYPSTWDAKKIKSQERVLNPVDLDSVVRLAHKFQLQGDVQIDFPKGKKGIYSISNKTSDLGLQKKIHLDQYTGKEILKHNWADVGVLMKARMWLMTFHQGEFGLWNWILVLGTAIIFFIMSVSAIASYLLRKTKGSWNVPQVPEKFKITYSIIIIIGLLGFVFPLFGLSIIFITLSNILYKKLTLN